jgi:hypothetical protein
MRDVWRADATRRQAAAKGRRSSLVHANSFACHCGAEFACSDRDRRDLKIPCEAKLNFAVKKVEFNFVAI